MGFACFSFRSGPGISQSIAFPIRLNDVNPVGDPVQQSAGQSFVTEDFRPVLERQVGGQNQTGSFISTADDFKQQFGPGLGERDVTELIEDDQMLFVEPFEETLQLSVLPGPPATV